MADTTTRLPDVVPASRDSSNCDTQSGGNTITMMNANQPVSSRAPSPSSSLSVEPPVVHIWSNSGDTCLEIDNPVSGPIVAITSTGTPPGSPIPPESSLMVDRRVSSHSSTSHSGDSGIDSLLPSPTVQLGHKAQTFVLDLSTKHLAVPCPVSLLSKMKQTTDQRECADEDEDADFSRVEDGNDSSTSATVDGDADDDHSLDASLPHGRSSSPCFLPQKSSHKNFLPLDYARVMAVPESPASSSWRQRAEHFQKIRRLPVEAAGSSIMSDCDSSSNNLKPGILDQDGQSVSSIEENYLGGSLSSSRKPSFSSLRSENGLDMTSVFVSGSTSTGGSSRTAKGSLGQQQQRHHHHQLSRSSSSRTFLSVPHRFASGSGPTVTSSDHHRQQPHQHSDRRRPSLGSHTDVSLSSLMASRFSLTKSLSPTDSAYLPLAMTDRRVDDLVTGRRSDHRHHKHHRADPSAVTRDHGSYSTVDNGLLIMDEDPCYEPKAAVTLSLTQRLAFPQLLEEQQLRADPEAGRLGHGAKAHGQRNDSMPTEESSLNFFAKIITFLVLVFVIVLVVGVLVKSSHTPR